MRFLGSLQDTKKNHNKMFSNYSEIPDRIIWQTLRIVQCFYHISEGVTSKAWQLSTIKHIQWFKCDKLKCCKISQIIPER